MVLDEEAFGRLFELSKSLRASLVPDKQRVGAQSVPKVPVEAQTPFDPLEGDSIPF